MKVSARGGLLSMAISAGILAGAAAVCRADSPAGMDSLGPPSIPITAAVSKVVAGVGLHPGPGTISFSIPNRNQAVLKQALLYWGKHTTPEFGSVDATDTITVEGVPVIGTRIGGPTDFFGTGALAASYRADITGLVTNGNNSLQVVVPPANANTYEFAYDGAGVLVTFSPKRKGGPTGSVAIRDGQDLAAYWGEPLPLHVTEPQTFNFPATSAARTFDLSLLVGSVSSVACGPSARPSIIQTTVGAVVQDFDYLGSNVGCELDVLTFPVSVPAGASSLTVQILSVCSDNPGCEFTPAPPASLAWIVGAVSIPSVEITGRMTGKICVFQDGTRVRGNVQLRCTLADRPQSLEMNWGGNRFHLESLTSITCSDDPGVGKRSAGFDTLSGTATGRYNGVPGATAEFTFVDGGEPGSNDSMEVVIRDASNTVVLAASGSNDCGGNLQAHR